MFYIYEINGNQSEFREYSVFGISRVVRRLIEDWAMGWVGGQRSNQSRNFYRTLNPN